MKDKTPVVKQLYRLSVEPRVVERLAMALRLQRDPLGEGAGRRRGCGAGSGRMGEGVLHHRRR